MPQAGPWPLSPGLDQTAAHRNITSACGARHRPRIISVWKTILRRRRRRRTFRAS
jgi:hypothetical protein